MSNKGCILFMSFRKGVEHRLRGDYSRALEGRSQERLYGVFYSRRGLLRIIERSSP